MVPQRYSIERRLHDLSKLFWRITGKIHPSMVSGYRVGAQQVYLVHNPKCAGTTLKKLLDISARRTTHSFPRQMFRRAVWEANIFVVAVRHPLERFVSSYKFHVKGPYKAKLVKRHGPAIKQLDIFEYFEFIKQYPENLAPQVNWTDYPSRVKPHCDIILKVEQSQRWADQLRMAGLAIPPDVVAGQSNVNRAESDGDLDHDLQLYAGDRAAELVRLIEAYYGADYQRFGYAQHRND